MHFDDALLDDFKGEIEALKPEIVRMPSASLLKVTMSLELMPTSEYSRNLPWRN